MGLDLDRGVMIRIHPSGIKIGMYLDAPGDYYTEAGEPIDRELARAAGFDIESDARKKIINRKTVEYRQQLEAEMASEEEALAVALSKSGEYDVRHVGGGQYALFGEDGVRVMAGTMSKADIELLIGRNVDEVPTGNPTGAE